jgi:hypothetical protein
VLLLDSGVSSPTDITEQINSRVKWEKKVWGKELEDIDTSFQNTMNFLIMLMRRGNQRFLRQRMLSFNPFIPDNEILLNVFPKKIMKSPSRVKKSQRCGSLFVSRLRMILFICELHLAESDKIISMM